MYTLYILEVNHFLHHVKEEFSEVLLAVETIAKLELIGKGSYNELPNNNYIYAYVRMYLLLFTYTYVAMYVCTYIGAFGMVHKGEIVTSDGRINAVAIKTIKCKSAIIHM